MGHCRKHIGYHVYGMDDILDNRLMKGIGYGKL